MLWFHKRLWTFSDFCNLLLMAPAEISRRGAWCLLLPCFQKHYNRLRISLPAWAVKVNEFSISKRAIPIKEMRMEQHKGKENPQKRGGRGRAGYGGGVEEVERRSKKSAIVSDWKRKEAEPVWKQKILCWGCLFGLARRAARLNLCVCVKKIRTEIGFGSSRYNYKRQSQRYFFIVSLLSLHVMSGIKVQLNGSHVRCNMLINHMVSNTARC